MTKRFFSDQILLAVTVALVFLGLLMVYSSSAALAEERYGNSAALFWRQLAGAVLGFSAMLLLMRVDYHRWRHPAVVFLGIFLAVALLVVALLAAPHQQTHRWLRWGPLSFQPSEFAKLMLMIFLAYWLEKRGQEVNALVRTLLPALVLVGVVLGLILKEPDLGTPVTIALVSAAVFYLAGLRLRYFAYLFLGSLPALYLLILRVPYRRNRVLAFLDPYADPQGTGFQIIQSMIAVGTGGVTGLGLMNGKQKLFFLPAPYTDFIFAVTAEELGLWGACLVLVLFGIYFWRGWRASLHAPDEFGRYLAAGLTLMIACQALINLSVVLGLVPPKGIPLPFLSYGGSSLVFSLAATGILLNISRHAAWGRKIQSLEMQEAGVRRQESE
ncbi:MAG: cell division protein FtsW [Acidobacteria bacterium RIFCSPLOWO2_02_FULL_61_28]|nr:MAG: cell division protein FtsW [Acidobacteria bacterium RIFCSPLOWO2_02_FULL_61_28]